jgi:hypothetical protein
MVELSIYKEKEQKHSSDGSGSSAMEGGTYGWILTPLAGHLGEPPGIACASWWAPWWRQSSMCFLVGPLVGPLVAMYAPGIAWAPWWAPWWWQSSIVVSGVFLEIP